MSKNQSEKSKCAIKTSIGGQALMEGIMMRGPKVTAIAVRNTKGEIVIEKEPTVAKPLPKIARIPIIRGVVNFILSMKIGYKALMRSAEISGLEELEEEMKREKQEKKRQKSLEKQEITEDAPAEAEEARAEIAEAPIAPAEAPAEEAKTDEKAEEKSASDGIGKKKEKGDSAMTSVIMIISVIVGVLLAIGLFIAVPSFLYGISIAKLLPADFEGNHGVLNSLIKSVFEGILKIALLVGYMAAISLMKDIRRVYMFHGAEHKTIFCYEAGLDLTVENIREQRRFHPRCGTSFLILMLLVSMLISFFIDPLFILTIGYAPATWIRVLVKLALVPIIMGIGYELIKIAGKHDNLFTRIISAPGMWLQHLTVFEPDDGMIECAIAAVKEVIPDDGSDRI